MDRSLMNFKPLSRFIHLSCHKSANVHRAFRKVLSLNGSRKRKFKFQEFPIIPDQNKFKEAGEKKTVQPVFRRVNVLNKLFMRYVTDLIINGDYWGTYTKLGVEITKVEIAPDYKQLNLFWISKKATNEDDIISFLSEHSYTLRHELSQLKVIGIVPPIRFVKDKHYTQMMELDKMMAQADYGDEYEPLSVTRLKHQLELYCPLEENVKLQLEKLDVSKEEEEEEAMVVELPEMPQNVLGLDHADIMRRITHYKKSQHTYTTSGENTRSWKSSGDVNDTTSSRDEFISFLHKRQIMSQKMKKDEKNYIPDREYIKQEFNKSFEEHYDNIEGNLDKFDDYYEDETEEK